MAVTFTMFVKYPLIDKLYLTSMIVSCPACFQTLVERHLLSFAFAKEEGCMVRSKPFGWFSGERLKQSTLLRVT